MSEKKLRWVDLFGIDPTYMDEELAAERERLFDVFRAGYEASASFHGPLIDQDFQGHDEDDVRQAFQEWLDEQVSDVDVIGMAVQTSDAAPTDAFAVDLSDTLGPSEVLGPPDWSRYGCLCLFEGGAIVRTDDLCPLHSKRPRVSNDRALQALIVGQNAIAAFMNKHGRTYTPHVPMSRSNPHKCAACGESWPCRAAVGETSRDDE